MREPALEDIAPLRTAKRDVQSERSLKELDALGKTVAKEDPYAARNRFTSFLCAMTAFWWRFFALTASLNALFIFTTNFLRDFTVIGHLRPRT